MRSVSHRRSTPVTRPGRATRGRPSGHSRAEPPEGRQSLSTAIASGQTIVGKVTGLGQLTNYTDAANAGQTTIVDLGDDVAASTFSPDLHVYGPDAALVGTGSGYYKGTGYAAAAYAKTSVGVAITAAKAGTYTFTVQDYSGSATGGTYALEVAAVPAAQATDANNNGKNDAGDTLATTDVNGALAFTGLVAGTYAVRVVQVSGTTTTTPGGAVRSVVVAAGSAVTGKVSGGKPTA